MAAGNPTELVPLAAAWAALGWLLGLGLDRLIYQLPRDLPVTGAPSCPTCGHHIGLVGRPGARCPKCGATTGYDRVEIVVAALFALLTLFYGLSTQLLVYSLYSLVLIVIAAIDARHRYVYTIVSYPSVLVSAVLSPTIPGVGLFNPLLGIAIGGGVFLVFYLVGRLLYRGAEPMGTGDITIAALVGGMVAFPRVLAALLLGSMASALLGILIVILRRSGRRTYIPYGPGLCVGAVAAFFITP